MRVLQSTRANAAIVTVGVTTPHHSTSRTLSSPSEGWHRSGHRCQRHDLAESALLHFRADRLPEAAVLPGGSPWWHAQQLSAARGFAFHLHATDPAAEIPPRHLIPARTSRATPSLYSAAEVAALMAATSRLRAAAYRALIGLLASTGMRVGEASALDHRRAVTSQVKDYGRVMGSRRSQIIHATLMYLGDLSPFHDMNSR